MTPTTNPDGLPVLRQNGVAINTTRLMEEPIDNWSDADLMEAHGILNFFSKQTAARLKLIKARIGERTQLDGVPNENGSKKLKLAGGSARYDLRKSPSPMESAIAPWCRANGYYDMVFPKIPSFQEAQLQALYDSGVIPEDVWKTFWDVKITPAVTVSDSPELTAYLKALLASSPQQVTNNEHIEG